MAIVWKKQHRGRCYEVRTAGRSVRLYTDGIFHSQWNESRPLAGHLWDLLFIPVFFHQSPDRVNHVLVLGVGGGAVINVFRHFFPRCCIDGVDLDPVHLSVAKRHFLKNLDNVRLIEGEATAYVNSNSRRYDVIIEDLFLGSCSDKADAVKPFVVDCSWLSAMRCRLKPKGLLVINFECLRRLKSSLTRDCIDKVGFSSVYALLHPGYENAIAVCLPCAMSRRQFEENIEIFFANMRRSVVKDLRYTIKKVF